MVIALVITPDGFPLVYEVMPGNTADKTTLREFLKRIEQQCGKIGRTWVMDRGIPTEEVLAEMRQSETPIHYRTASCMCWPAANRGARRNKPCAGDG